MPGASRPSALRYSRRPISKARQNKVDIDWSSYQPPKPKFTGTRVFKEVNLAEIRRYIDWTPFFSTLGDEGPISTHSC